MTRPATAKCNLALVDVCARVGVSLDHVFITSFFPYRGRRDSRNKKLVG